MNGERGFTLFELLVVIIISTTVGLAFSETIGRMRTEVNASTGYSQDVRTLRRVSRLLREDLSNAASVSDLDWRHESDRLYRGGREVARNIEDLIIISRQDQAFVCVCLGSRNRHAGREGAEVFLRVRMRNAGRER